MQWKVKRKKKKKQPLGKRKETVPTWGLTLPSLCSPHKKIVWLFIYLGIGRLLQQHHVLDTTLVAFSVAAEFVLTF